MSDYDSKIKVILIGESGVGKTCLIRAYEGKKFTNVLASSGPGFIKKEIKKDDKTYQIHLWDTAGQEKYRCVNKIFIKDSHIAILVYDITKRKTFQELDYWVNYTQEILGKDVVFGLAGNKIDLFDKNDIEEEGKIVTKQEGMEYAEEIGASFKETSAKGDAKGFIEFVDELIDKYLSSNIQIRSFEGWEIISLHNPIKKKKEKCC